MLNAMSNVTIGNKAFKFKVFIIKPSSIDDVNDGGKVVIQQGTVHISTLKKYE